MTMLPVARPLPLDNLDWLELHNVDAAVATYRGRRALRIIEREQRTQQTDSIAVVTASHFTDGVIEFALAADRRPEANEGARGFAGIAFRVAPGGARFECFYLRPTNGRADDQLRRNHATQYISFPDWPWQRLRAESPGVYESYTDLVPGVWTSVKVAVTGVRAQLFVHGAEQPCLIVNELKHGASAGAIALWIGSGTEAYFSDLTVS